MRLKIIFICFTALILGSNIKGNIFDDAWSSIKSGATTVYEKAIKPAATTVYEKAIVPVHQAVVKPFLQEVVEPTVQKVIKPAYQKVVAPIAEPIIKKVGAPIFEKVIAPAINFVGDKIADPIYQNTIAKIYDVKTAIKDLINKGIQGARDISKKLREGADKLEKAPDQFKPGIEELEKLPPKLADGAKKVQDSIATINKALEQVRAQRESVKKQNLAKLGMQALETNLMEAFSQLETGLLKLATTDAKGQCGSGILCNFMNTLLKNKTNIEQNITKIKDQVNILTNKVKGNQAKGTLPTRMRDLASILDLP